MLGRVTALVMLLVASLSAPAASSAYELNPFKDRKRGGEWPMLTRPYDTVHEDITYAAIACADGLRDRSLMVDHAACVPRIIHRKTGAPGNIRNPLIVGLWWNDDPRHFLFAGDVLSAAIQWADAQHSARRLRESGGRYWNVKMRRMLFRSHFGGLQFLHGLANHDGESPEETQRRIIGWLGFTYAVAIGEVSPDTRLSELGSPVPEAFAEEPRLTVDKLFRPRSGMRHLSLQQLALGSMLHLVQDSYAAAHARRDGRDSARCRNGRVTQFYSHLYQDTDLHRAEDTRSALNSRGLASIQNPVESSARLILMTRRHSDWATVVEPYLRSTVFCLDRDAAMSGPGPYRLARTQHPSGN